jgi:diadenosine tetraphosphatase ApaH/serine/threonine PP2A family protein phosphatase
MRAILSDIHGNLEALEAVLTDAAACGASSIYCLGDLVGYGPNPVECVDVSMDWDVVLLGNHDQAAMFDPDGFGQSAEKAIFWTRARLETAGRNDLWEFLAERPRTHQEPGFLHVHGSPWGPLNEYLFPEDVYNPQKMTRIGELMERYCFAGHTHVPGVFVEEAPGRWSYLVPEECGPRYRLDGRKTIVNAGSVGQPRDGDWRACYVLLDDPDVTFRRVEYDVEATVRKIYDIPELENFLGDRLREGR